MSAVEMLSFKLRRVENGNLTDVVLIDCGFWKRNWGTLKFKLKRRRNKGSGRADTADGKWKDVGKGDTVTVKLVVAKCLVLGDSIVRNVGAEKPNMRVKFFPGIRADHLRRVMENRNIGTQILL